MMGQHINLAINARLLEVNHPRFNLDRGVHFPDSDILDHSLANEVGLSPNNQSAHWNISSASLFNRYPVFAFQYKQLNTVIKVKPDRKWMATGRLYNNFDEFIKSNQSEDKSTDVPDTIWIP
jgi:hypothetical protein